MKIVLTQEEIMEMMTSFLKDKYSGLLSEKQAVTKIKNLGNNYSNVELIVEDKEVEGQ